MKLLTRIALLVCALTALPAVAGAQTLTDERVWFTLNLQEQGSPDSPWKWTMETILRSRERLSSLDVLSLRPTVIYSLDKHSSIGAGYAFAPSFPPAGGATVEHRLYGQYIWTGGAAGGTLTMRTRVEARMIENNSGTLGRVRQQVRFSHPLHQGSRTSIVAYDELFVHVNNTTRSARGIDQNRIFGGLAIAASRATRVELGYLNA